MKRLIFTSSLLIVFITSISFSQAPKYYIKKGTWLETLVQSREELAKEEKSIKVKYNPVLGTWYMNGPWKSEHGKAFEQKFPPEDNADISVKYGERKWEPKPDWKDGVAIDLPSTSDISTYLIRNINSDRDTTITGYFGSDDGIKVWLNGKIILNNNIDRSIRPNQDNAQLNLVKGDNKLLMKINNNSGPSGFYFSLKGMEPRKLIWYWIVKDFTSVKDILEISWNRGDKIWDEDWQQGDFSTVAKKYADAVGDISVKAGGEILKEAAKSVDFIHLKAIHEKYLLAKKSEYVPLTPKPSAKPRINGAKVFGVRPNAPFQFKIAATGKAPIEFSIKNLPKSLKLNKKTGIITGMLDIAAEYNLTIKVSNSVGSAERSFNIICGDQVALTPPMGWNSWNCFAGSVSAEKVKAAADEMVKKGLINHGWTYINIDDFWETRPGSSDPTLQGDPRDKDGFIIPNKRFPDMKELSSYIHGKGLKMG